MKTLKKSTKYFILFLFIMFSLGFSFLLPVFDKKSLFQILTEHPQHDDSVVLGDDNCWIIDDDTVYTNNSKFYASACPHTLSSRGWVEFEFESKGYDGDVDFIWGFNGSNARPTKNVQIWKNYTHEVYSLETREIYGSNDILNVTSYDNLGIENYDDYPVIWGTKNNTYLFEIITNNNPMSNVIAFSDYQTQGNDYRLFGNYNKTIKVWNNETYFDWMDIELDYEKINYNFRNMTTWYLIKDQPIINNKIYKIRAWIDIPFGGFEGSSGKYWWAFKLSSETIHEALQNNHLFYLDPWWDSNWGYSKKITIDHTKVAEDVINFPVLINISSDSDLVDNALSDGSDIAFVDSTNITQYNHEIERYVSGTGQLIAWVNVTSISSSVDTVIWMYYGNAGASNQSNPEGVWNESYVNVQHMTGSGTSSDSTSNGIDFANSGTISDVTSKIGDGRTWDGTSDYLSNNDASLNPALENRTISFWLRSSDTGNKYLLSDYQSGSQEWDINGLNSNEFFRIYSTGYGYRYIGTSCRDGNWHYVTFVINRPTGYIYAYRDGVASNGASNSISDVGSVTSTATTYIGHYSNALLMDIDEFRIYKYMRSANWILTEYNNQNNPSAFYSLGDENVGNYNLAPTLSGEVPGNQSTSISTTPSLHVLCLDNDADTMNATWSSNSSGSWQDFATNSSIANNTNITQTNSNFSAYSTKYWWKVNLSDGNGLWCNETYYFATEANSVPAFSGESPGNTSTGISLAPRVFVIVTDANSDTMDCNFYNSTDGSTWVHQQKNATVSTGTNISYSYTEASDYNTKYYWKITADDGTDNVSAIYHFTTVTNTAPILSNPSPVNNSVDQALTPKCAITVADPDGDSMTLDWYTSPDGSSWTWRQTNSSASNGTYYYEYTGASGYLTTYYWMVAVNDSVVNVSDIYHFTTGPLDVEREIMQVFNLWYQCGNESIVTTSEVFESTWQCGNESILTPIDIFNLWYLCGNHTLLTPTIVYNSWYLCGNESIVTTSNIFDIWYLCSNTSTRIDNNLFNLWYLCSNESSRLESNLYDWTWQCGNESSVTTSNIFESTWICGNESIRTETNIYESYYICGNNSGRNETLIYDYYWLCGNNSARTITNILNLWYLCGNHTLLTPTIVYNSWYLCGNEIVRTSTDVFIAWYQCGNETTKVINITEIYPANNSWNIPLQPTMYLTINHTTGNNMNITWYYGPQDNINILLGTDIMASNGTASELNYNASARATTYYWRIMVDDGSYYMNYSYIFKTEGYAGGVGYQPTSNSLWVIGILGMIGLAFIFLGIKKRNERDDY